MDEKINLEILSKMYAEKRCNLNYAVYYACQILERNERCFDKIIELFKKEKFKDIKEIYIKAFKIDINYFNNLQFYKKNKEMCELAIFIEGSSIDNVPFYLINKDMIDKSLINRKEYNFKGIPIKYLNKELYLKALMIHRKYFFNIPKNYLDLELIYEYIKNGAEELTLSDIPEKFYSHSLFRKLYLMNFNVSLIPTEYITSSMVLEEIENGNIDILRKTGIYLIDNTHVYSLINKNINNISVLFELRKSLINLVILKYIFCTNKFDVSGITNMKEIVSYVLNNLGKSALEFHLIDLLCVNKQIFKYLSDDIITKIYKLLKINFDTKFLIKKLGKRYYVLEYAFKNKLLDFDLAYSTLVIMYENKLDASYIENKEIISKDKVKIKNT